MNHKHLTDDRLIELCLGGAGTPAADPHLADCQACETRRSTLAQMLDDVAQAAAAEADAVFTPERLARQHARILQRIDLDGRPGRVLAFPAAPAYEPPALRTRPASRWVAAAAAAGLVIGLLAGHLAHDLPEAARVQQPPPRTTETAASSPIRPATSTTMSDDEFLGQIDRAINAGGPIALRPLHVLTPRAWDVPSR